VNGMDEPSSRRRGKAARATPLVVNGQSYALKPDRRQRREFQRASPFRCYPAGEPG
jgi:hypothetical protein